MFQNKKSIFISLALFLVLALVLPLVQAENTENNAGTTFFWIAIILLAAKFSSLIERIGQPSVLGELIVGVILGNLVLLGINLFEPIKTDSLIKFLAELGVVILLFQIGLESTIEKMRKVGVRAFLVACVGVAVPFFWEPLLLALCYCQDTHLKHTCF